MIATTATAATIVHTLAPWRRQLRLARCLRWSLRGVIVGLTAAVLALVVGRLTPWADASAVAARLLGVCVVGAALIGLAVPVSARRAASSADRVAGLADRVVTAWELRDRDESFARLQRADALARLRLAGPASLQPRPARREVIALAVVAVMCAIALLAPNPMTEILRQQQAEQARIRTAQQQVQALTVPKPAEDNQPALDQAQLDQAVRELAQQLGQAKDAPSALAAISKTEQSVRAQIPSGGDQAAAALGAEAAALQQNAATRPLGNALATRDSASLAKASAALQAALARLTPAERAAVGRALQNAADAGTSASSSPDAAATSASLRAAAQAVQQGDLGEAGAQLGAAQSNLSQQLAATQVTASAQQTIAGLEQARGTVSGVASVPGSQTGAGQGSQPGQASAGQAGTAASQTGLGAGPNGSGADQTGSGAGQSGGAAGDTGQGTGSGQGAGPGQGAGAGDGTGTRAGGTGGRAASGGTRAAEPGKTTPGDQVFVPGQAGAGPSLQQTGPAGPALGSEVPYQQVIGQYAQSAREHVDRGSLPPEVRDLVRKYFVGLEEGSGQ
ncbi:MAG TPA: hypothetical protein VNL16_15725 [Chloroflexota bacterium]|nr:hypothetical protein [Chloroflexota bacterium]